MLHSAWEINIAHDMFYFNFFFFFFLFFSFLLFFFWGGGGGGGSLLPSRRKPKTKTETLTNWDDYEVYCCCCWWWWWWWRRWTPPKLHLETLVYYYSILLKFRFWYSAQVLMLSLRPTASRNRKAGSSHDCNWCVCAFCVLPSEGQACHTGCSLSDALSPSKL